MKKYFIIALFICYITNSYSQNSEEYYKIGIDYFTKKDYIGSIDAFTKAIDLTLFETDVNVRKKILDQSDLKKQVAYYFQSRGLAKFEIQDYAGAEKDFWNVTMIIPDFPEGHFQKGKAYYELKMYELAIYGFNETIKIDSTDAEAYFRRGLAKHALDNFKGAIDDYTKALAIHCCPADAFYQRGRAKGRLGDDQGAIDDQTRAIELDPNFAPAYQERAMEKINLHDYTGAMQDFNTSLKIIPNAITYRSRGLLKMILKDYLGAIDDCSESIKLDPDFPSAYMTRGMAKIRLNQKDSGCLDLSKAGELGLTQAYEEIQRLCNK